MDHASESPTSSLRSFRPLGSNHKVLATVTVQIRAVVEGVHLVDPDVADPRRVRLDGIADRDRLTNGERHDEIRTVLDQTQDVLGLPPPLDIALILRASHGDEGPPHCAAVDPRIPTMGAEEGDIVDATAINDGGSAEKPSLPTTARLRDGTLVDIVAMRPSDAVRLVRFHQTLSKATTYMRFFSFHPELSPDELYRFTHVDHRDREAVVAVADGEIVGVARFDRVDDSADAEVAFVVADSWQGRGLGTLLFENLARRARAVGIDRLVADTLAHNRPMLAVFHRAGLPVTDHIEAGVAHVVIDLGRTHEARESHRSRDSPLVWASPQRAIGQDTPRRVRPREPQRSPATLVSSTSRLA